MQIAIKRIFPAAEREEGHRHRHPDVDAEHPRLHRLPEHPGRRAALGVDHRRVPEPGPIHHPDRLFQAVRANDAQHRGEQFFPSHRHLRIHPVQNRRPKEEPLGQPLHGVPAVPGHDRPFRQPLMNSLHHPGPVFGANQGPQLHPLLQAVADPHPVPGFHQGLHQGITHRSHRHHHTTGHTALTRRPETRVPDGVHRPFEIRVRHHDVVIFRPGQSLHPFPRGRRRPVHVLGYRLGANKGNGIHPGVRQEGVHHLFAPVNQIEHPFGNPGFHGQLHQSHGSQGGPLRRFQHKGIPRRQGDGHHPHGHHHGKIKGHDARHDTHGVADHLHVDPPGHLGTYVPLHEGGHPGREFHHFNAAPHLAPGVVQGLAVFGGHQAGQLLHPLDQKLPPPEHHPGPLHHRYFPPGFKRLPGGPNRPVHIRSCGQGHLCQKLPGGRIGHRQDLISLRCLPHPANKIFEPHLLNRRSHASHLFADPLESAYQNGAIFSSDKVYENWASSLDTSVTSRLPRKSSPGEGPPGTKKRPGRGVE
ncbi:protein of unknown function [Kyrpidia spormannii]|uniref:Uncharacterized protein n=1 Tax=Kyrpidia spormannii TaxID=2055160 RepID=A0A6F9EGY7_9BACL|nr:protein of unknown function [Kyrpidia spormannii]